MTLIFINRDVYMWVVLIICYALSISICVCVRVRLIIILFFVFYRRKNGNSLNVIVLLLLKKKLKNKTHYRKIYHLNIHTFYTHDQNRFFRFLRSHSERFVAENGSTTERRTEIDSRTMNRMRSFYELTQRELLSHSQFLWDDFRSNI